MSNVLHIVLGDTAGGSLHEACRTLGMPGSVFPIPDDLSHGPLDDGTERARYFRSKIYGYDDLEVPDDAFGCWRELEREIQARRIDRVVIWYSDTVSDQVFLRMACSHLRRFAGEVERVNTSVSGWSGVGVNSPEQLRRYFDLCQPMSRDQVDAFGAEFEIIQERRDLLRGMLDDKIVSLPVDHYDTRIMSFVTKEWERAVRIVGNCMGCADDHNLIGDFFYSWRLQQLIDAGQLEAEGDRSKLRGYRVRLRAQ